MKALKIDNPCVTKEALLEEAQDHPLTWLGIRVAAGLLVLKGWTTSQVAELFDVSRWTAVQWIQRLNEEGVSGLEEKPGRGRPSGMDEDVQKLLAQALMKDPREAGLSRNRWDGASVVEYLEREHGIHIKERQAQRWIRRMGFSLRPSICRYVLATSKGVESLVKGMEKTRLPSQDKTR